MRFGNYSLSKSQFQIFLYLKQEWWHYSSLGGILLRIIQSILTSFCSDEPESDPYNYLAAAKEGMIDIKTTTEAVTESDANIKTKTEPCVCENCPVMENSGHQKCCRQIRSWMDKNPSTGL